MLGKAGPNFIISSIMMPMDPVKDGGNWYQYCYSNTAAYIDLLGLGAGDCYMAEAVPPPKDVLSSQYANRAEGMATYVHPGGYEGEVWLGVNYRCRIVARMAV